LLFRNSNNKNVRELSFSLKHIFSWSFHSNSSTAYSWGGQLHNHQNLRGCSVPKIIKISRFFSEL